MLRFLGNLRQHLLTENRFGSYLLYAIGEIVLVVIGILIAIQINNWNEWRKDRVTEREILGDVKNTLERNYALLNLSIARMDSMDQSAEIIKKHFRDNLPETDALRAHYSMAFATDAYNSVLNTDGYKSLENHGFDIIVSRKLKDEIIQLFEISYAQYANTLLRTQSMVASSYSNKYIDYFYVLNDQGTVARNFESLRTSKEYETHLNLARWSRNQIRTSAKACLGDTRQVLQLIDEALGE